jgi:hypothetical protein
MVRKVRSIFSEKIPFCSKTTSYGGQKPELQVQKFQNVLGMRKMARNIANVFGLGGVWAKTLALGKNIF